MSPPNQIQFKTKVPKQLTSRFNPTGLLESGVMGGSKERPIIHMGGEMYPKRKAPRIVPIDPHRKRNAEWLDGKARHFDFKEASFPVATLRGIEQVQGYAAYSKKTGQPKTYFVPRSRFQE